jgi:hypothetical protein
MQRTASSFLFRLRHNMIVTLLGFMHLHFHAMILFIFWYHSCCVGVFANYAFCITFCDFGDSCVAADGPYQCFVERNHRFFGTIAISAIHILDWVIGSCFSVLYFFSEIFLGISARIIEATAGLEPP